MIASDGSKVNGQGSQRVNSAAGTEVSTAVLPQVDGSVPAPAIRADLPNLSQVRIAVLIPCYNEEKTIARVVRDFRAALPQAEIIVFDNNSTDASRALAIQAGAAVVHEKRQGKGFVVASMMKKVAADYYLMVDGDDTYPAERCLDLLAPLLREEADMVVGQRLARHSDKAFRPLHYGGNKLVCRLINTVFGTNLTDPMSGYRAYTCEVAQELPIVASGFDVETEMTLQLLYRKFIIKEVAIDYRERPAGSVSKLRTFRDGLRVLVKIFAIVRAYKPLTFFGGLGLLVAGLGGGIGAWGARLYLLAEQASSLLWIVSAIGLILAGIILAAVGIVLHTLNFRLLELSSIQSKILYHHRQTGDHE